MRKEGSTINSLSNRPKQLSEGRDYSGFKELANEGRTGWIQGVNTPVADRRQRRGTSGRGRGLHDERRDIQAVFETSNTLQLLILV